MLDDETVQLIYEYQAACIKLGVVFLKMSEAHQERWNKALVEGDIALQHLISELRNK